MVKRVIFNGDDYGLCTDVDEAIEMLIEADRLKDISLLANGERSDSAARFLHEHKEISVGAHLNVVEGRPVSTSNQIRSLTNSDGYFIGLRSLLLRWVKSPWATSRAVEIEWRAQLARLRAMSLMISHIDSHQHLHAFPPAWRIAARLAVEFRIPAVRLPLDRSDPRKRRMAALSLNASLAVSTLMTNSICLRHNDNFLGFRRAGGYTRERLIADLRQMPPGLIEVAFHPSLRDHKPYPHVLGGRERLVLMDDALYEQLDSLGIVLTTWNANRTTNDGH